MVRSAPTMKLNIGGQTRLRKPKATAPVDAVFQLHQVGWCRTKPNWKLLPGPRRDRGYTDAAGRGLGTPCPEGRSMTAKAATRIRGGFGKSLSRSTQQDRHETQRDIPEAAGELIA